VRRRCARSSASSCRSPGPAPRCSGCSPS
jgi:hypothetical protein